MLSSWRVPRIAKLRITVAAALMSGVVGLVSAPSAQAVQGGTAVCDALDVAISAAVGGVPILNLSGGTDDVTAPSPDNGTNTNSGTIAVGGDADFVTVDLLRCDATRAPGFLSAEAEITDGVVTLGGSKSSRWASSPQRFSAPRQAPVLRRQARRGR